MSLPVVLRQLALQDVEQIHDELDAQVEGLRDRFINQLQKVLDRIEALPELYAEVWSTVRAARLRKFRHVVYYVILATQVEVIAVIHGSRDAKAWQLRL